MNPRKPKSSLRQLIRLVASGGQSLREISRLTGYHSDKVRFINAIIGSCPFDVSQLDLVTDTQISEWLSSRSTRRGFGFHEPDLAAIIKILAKKSCSREELFNQYKTEPSVLPKMAQRTFYNRIQNFSDHPDLVLQLDHKPGECMQVDYAGFQPAFLDAETRSAIRRQLFLSTCGTSALLFAVSTADQTTNSWLEAHIAALEFYGGVPLVWICDNLKAAVIGNNGRGRVKLNPVYNAFADHYQAIVRPARPKRPRDKGRVEAAVKLVQSELQRSLDKRPAFSIADLDTRILEIVNDINNRPMQRLNGESRRRIFDELDRPSLQPLPSSHYDHFEVELGRVVGRNYAVHFRGNEYSVNHTLAGKLADVHASTTEVLIISDGVLVARHPRLTGHGGSSFLDEHRPANHLAMLESEEEKLALRMEPLAEESRDYIRQAIECKIKAQSRRAAISTALLITRNYDFGEIDDAIFWCIAKQYMTLDKLDACLAGRLWSNTSQDSLRTEQPPAIQHSNIRGPQSFAKRGPVQ
jgi:transposase